MSEVSSIKVDADDVLAGVIDVGERLKGIRNGGQDAPVLIKGKTIESLEAPGLIIESRISLGLAEGRVEAARQSRKRPSGYDGIEQILLVSLTGDKKEKFVFDNRSTHGATKLVSLEIIGRVAGKRGI